MHLFLIDTYIYIAIEKERDSCLSIKKSNKNVCQGYPVRTLFVSLSLGSNSKHSTEENFANYDLVKC